jgi:hypothetical protein
MPRAHCRNFDKLCPREGSHEFSIMKALGVTVILLVLIILNVSLHRYFKNLFWLM